MSPDLAPGLITAGALLLIFALAPRQAAWSRVAVSAIVLLCLVRYVAWRFAYLPAPDSAAGIWNIACFAFEMLLASDTAVLFIMLSRTISRSGAADAHERRLRAMPPALLPTVDVIIPTYNEGLDVLERSIVGALGIDYPRLTVWVLDDGKRDWLKEWCAKKGAKYLRREGNAHAKAGNINQALPHLKGEFVAIFDADFVPHRNFVYRTLGFFEDAKIGIVQTPQHFFNKDPIQLNLGLDRVWPDEQRLFFHTIMPARDAWGAAFCCGSCALVRRTALDAIGGIPTQSVTEDILASLVMIRHGFTTIYLDEQLSLGLAPESIEGFFVQRKRWCRGNIQLIYLKSGPAGPGLPWMIRLFCLPTYYLLQPAQLLFQLIPVAYLWGGLSPLVPEAAESLLQYQTPALVSCFMALIWFSRASWVPILSTATNLFQAVRLTPTVLTCYIKPFGVPFKVTPKGGLDTRLIVDRNTALFAGILLALTITGLIANTSLFRPFTDDDPFFHMAGLWAIWNALTLFLLLLMAIERPRRRTEERFQLNDPASCRLDGTEIACEVLDLSAGGAKLRFPHDLAVTQGSELTIHLAIVGTITGRIVWSAKGAAGIRFGALAAPVRTALGECLHALSLATAERGRRQDRIEIALPASCVIDDIEAECTVRNASLTGLLLEVKGPAPRIGSTIAIEMPNVGRVDGEVVRQVGADGFGIRYGNLSEATRDRLIRRLYTQGTGYPQRLDIQGGALVRALLARAFG